MPHATSTDLCRLSAIELSRAFHAGEVTVEEYAKALLKRIRERDAVVNAWVYLDPASILDQARKLDQVPRAERGLLHGIAVAVKDVIYVKGMPTQHGSPIYEGNQVDVDAASVMMLRKAGALIFGKTTTTEFAATNVGTKTSNAFDPARTPGGSSSGSAAAVADFQVTLATGTQTGGSIIRPASYNGIYGFKPTWNAISRDGQKIHSLILDTLGYFARSVEDLQLLGTVFGLQDDQPPRPIPNGTRGLKLAFCKTMVWHEAGPGTSAALENGVELLKLAGADVEELHLPPEFDGLPDWHTCIAYFDARVSFRPEYMLAKDKLAASLLQDIESRDKYTRKDYVDALDRIAALRPKWDRIAARYAAIVVPSVIDEAPVGLEFTGSHIFNRIWTALHTPVVNIPAFGGRNDMPVGLSLTTARFNDEALLEVAKVVNAAWISQSSESCP